MTIDGIVADLKTSRGDLGRDAAAWLRTLAKTGHDLDCDSCFWEGTVTVCDEGKVFRSTAPAVPYLSRLAAAGVHTVELLELIGEIGQSTRGKKKKKARTAHEAALRELPMILTLAEEGETSVRCAALRAAAAFDVPEPVLPVLERLWTRENDPVIRAETLRAYLRLDAEVGARFAAEVLRRDEAGVLQAMAVAAVVEDGATWSPDLHRAMTMSYPLYVESQTEAENDPLVSVVETLSARGEWASGCDLAEALLVLPRRRAVRKEALRMADELCESFRPAPARLLPALIPLLSKRGTARDAARLIRQFGSHAAPAADALAVLAAGSRANTASEEALTALVALGDGRAASLVAHHLSGRVEAGSRTRRRSRWPQVMDAVKEHGLPFDTDLMYVIREWMRTWPADSDALFTQAMRTEEWTTIPTSNHAAVLSLLARWGADANPVLGELLALLPIENLDVPATLVAIAHSDEDRVSVEDALRLAATQGKRHQRMKVAHALHSLTGDTGPLLAEIESGMSSPTDHYWSVEAARELGESARPLLPVMREALRRLQQTAPKDSWAGNGLQPAMAIWRLTGETEDVLPILLTDIADPRRQSYGNAVEAAEELGPAAQSAAVPLARALVSNPYNVMPETRALLSVCREGDLPEGVSPAMLADALLATMAAHRPEGLTLLADIGLEHVDAAGRERLEALADGERRFSQQITHDEALRAVATALLNPGEHGC
jgi:hypothetical protein